MCINISCGPKSDQNSDFFRKYSVVVGYIKMPIVATTGQL